LTTGDRRATHRCKRRRSDQRKQSDSRQPVSRSHHQADCPTSTITHNMFSSDGLGSTTSPARQPRWPSTPRWPGFSFHQPDWKRRRKRWTGYGRDQPGQGRGAPSAHESAMTHPRCGTAPRTTARLPTGEVDRRGAPRRRLPPMLARLRANLHQPPPSDSPVCRPRGDDCISKGSLSELSGNRLSAKSSRFGKIVPDGL
jgi:hypothetical protein